MSAINIFAVHHAAVRPHTVVGRRQVLLQEVRNEVVPVPGIVPIVIPRWSVEIDLDGKRRLVRHWFENKGAK